MRKIFLIFLSATSLAQECRVSIYTAISKLEICQGQIARFSAVSTGAVSYKWEGPNGFISTNESIAVVGRSTASGSYSVVVSDTSGCTSTSTVQLTVLPVITCYLTPDPAFIASGEALDFTINVEGGTPPFRFNWWGPDGFTSTNQTTTVSTEGFYIGSVTDSRGCNNSDSVYLHVESR